MSLINRVLQDLEARHAPPPADVPVPGQVRAVAAAQPRGRRGLAVLILGLLVAGVIAFALTQNPSLIAKLGSSGPDASPMVPAGTATQTPVETANRNGSVQAQVEAALMMPVFQLSEELSIVPRARRPAAGAANVASGARQATQSKDGTAETRVAASAQPPERQAEAAAVTASEAGEKDDVVTSAPAVARPAVDEKKVAKTAVPAGTAGTDASADDVEQVEIPADVGTVPIEKQARQLTSFERAENLFRLGATSLRQGHMADAESRFRAAIEEDRSHHAAQQALVGILIDAGRLEDAEAVLAESLSANPRQPKSAMILARLQIERGDVDMAMRTLENTRTYAGTDAVYMSFMAAVLQRAGRHEDAVVQYQNALAFMPRNAIWLMGLGISLRALGRNGQALQVFDESAAIGSLEPGLQAFVDQQRAQLARAVN